MTKNALLIALGTMLMALGSAHAAELDDVQAPRGDNEEIQAPRGVRTAD